MSNPLNRGGYAPQSTVGNIPVPPHIAETIQQIAGMIQQGTDFYAIAKALKSKNITPQAVERGLYAVMPQLRQVKQQMAQMGINPQQFVSEFMKQNNISGDELKEMICDFAKRFVKR